MVWREALDMRDNEAIVCAPNSKLYHFDLLIVHISFHFIAEDNSV